MELKDDDYILSDGAGWFDVDGFAIRIEQTDEGVVVDVYKKGAFPWRVDGSGPITSCYAFYSELEEV